LQLDVNSPATGLGQVVMTDLQGKEVMHEAMQLGVGRNRAQYDVSALAKGMYVLRLAQGDQNVVRKVVLK